MMSFRCTIDEIYFPDDLLDGFDFTLVIFFIRLQIFKRTSMNILLCLLSVG